MQEPSCLRNAKRAVLAKVAAAADDVWWAYVACMSMRR